MNIDKIHYDSNLFKRIPSLRRKKVYQYFWIIAYVVLGILSSTLFTFYSYEAELRGATSSQIGAVFGLLSLTTSMTSFYVSSAVAKHGVKLCFCSGALIEGLCGFSYSFLSYISNGSLFIGLSIIIRLITGFGIAMKAISGIGLLLTINPEKVNIGI